MSIQNNFPAIRPSLNLDFANTKELDPRITFTRASTASYYGTQTAKAEENLLTYSQEFDVAWTDTTVTTTDNNSAAPNGTTTASLIQASGAAARVGLSRAPTITSGVDYAISFFAKAGTNDIVQLAGIAGLFSGNGQANFDLTNGVLGTVSGGTATITAVGSGWYRCTWIVTSLVTSGVIYLTLINSTTASRFDSTGIVSGDNVSLWGAQLEQRSAVTDYTPTTTQPITNYIPVLETAASGVARFDHNPTTFESLGFLVEEQRTNLVTYSEQFDDAAWAKSNSSITANTIVSPDGTLDGDKLVEDTANTSHNINRNQSVTTGTSYAFTIYAKAAERSFFRLQSFNAIGDAENAVFDLATGTIFSQSGTSASTITPVGNGWYRCSVIVINDTDTNSTLSIQLFSDGTTSSYTGDGYSGIYIWGAQLEAGAFPTSYIPTVASQVTRAADAASMTGVNFSSWYRADEGTFFASVLLGQLPALSNSAVLYCASDNTSSNSIQVRCGTGAGGNINALVSTGNVTQAQTINGGLSTAGAYLYANTYKTNDFASVVNGGAEITDTSGTVPVVDRFFLGATAVGTPNFNSHIRKLSYYGKRLSNEELQGLTG